MTGSVSRQDLWRLHQAGDEVGQLSDSSVNTRGTLSIFLDEGIPAEILPDITGYEWMTRSDDRESASLVIHEASKVREGDYIYQNTMQVYALVAPFPTLLDDVSIGEVKKLLEGGECLCV